MSAEIVRSSQSTLAIRTAADEGQQVIIATAAAAVLLTRQFNRRVASAGGDAGELGRAQAEFAAALKKIEGYI